MKKVPGDNNRDINGLLNRDSYKSEAKSWNDTYRIWQTAGLTWHPREERVVEKEVTIYMGIHIRLSHQFPGKPAEELVPHGNL